MQIHIRACHVELPEICTRGWNAGSASCWVVSGHGSAASSSGSRTPTVTGVAGARCQIDVGLRPSGSVQSEDTDTDLFVAVHRAADRVARAVARVLARERD